VFGASSRDIKMTKTHMDGSTFEKTAEWQKLSVRQKYWMQTYLASGNDQVFATQLAYNTTEKSTRTFSYEVIKQKKIQAALNRYFNRSEKDISLAQLEREIKKAKGTARIKLQMQFAELKFGNAPKKSKGKSNGKSIREQS
jgi:hypothetical protein